MSDPFIAEIRIFAGNFAPRGWAFCDGQLLQISQNTALFSLIGTTYGGDGRTTTALPNLHGRAPMHPGRGPGLTDRRLGQGGGVTTVTISESQMPNHNHTPMANRLSQNPDLKSSEPGNHTWASNSQENNFRPAADRNVNMSAQAIGQTGGSQPHNNMQPFLTMYFIIALQGVYPSWS